MTKKIQTLIYPERLICNKKSYDIQINNNKFIIKEYEIITNNEGTIKDIRILDGLHPNCNPSNNYFCLPSFIKKLKVTEETIFIIENMFKVFNFNSAFYLPWESIEYRKVNNINVN